MKKVFTENQFYKELERANVGIDFCEWEDGSAGFIYFEEIGDNHSEAFYKNIEGALEEYLNAEEYFGKKRGKENGVY